jgi:hypothetical protein
MEKKLMLLSSVLIALMIAVNPVFCEEIKTFEGIVKTVKAIDPRVVDMDDSIMDKVGLGAAYHTEKGYKVRLVEFPNVVFKTVEATFNDGKYNIKFSSLVGEKVKIYGVKHATTSVIIIEKGRSRRPVIPDVESYAIKEIRVIDASPKK